MQIGVFSIVYDGRSVVTLTARAQDGVQFDNYLSSGDHLRTFFKRSQQGSDWGSDGVGYLVQKNLRQVVLHRSGVGPVNFRRGLEQYRREVLHA